MSLFWAESNRLNVKFVSKVFLSLPIFIPAWDSSCIMYLILYHIVSMYVLLNVFIVQVQDSPSTSSSTLSVGRVTRYLCPCICSPDQTMVCFDQNRKRHIPYLPQHSRYQAGNYSCHPDNLHPATISLHVLSKVEHQLIDYCHVDHHHSSRSYFDFHFDQYHDENDGTPP